MCFEEDVSMFFDASVTEAKFPGAMEADDVVSNVESQGVQVRGLGEAEDGDC